MKKWLLLLTAFMATASVQAQIWWGYFSESDFSIHDSSIGIGNAVPFMAAIYVPASHEQIGSSTIKGVRVYFDANTVQSSVSEVKIWISKTLPSTADAADYVQTVNEALKEGANEFTLDTPYAINNQAVYIGYYIDCSCRYPIRCGGDDTSNALFINAVGTIDWSDLSGNNFGKLALQILVDGATVNSDCASISNFAPLLAGPGQDVEVPVNVTNMGSNDIASISYTVTVNGNTSTEQTVSTSSIPYNGTRKVNLTLTTASVEGEFTYTITITKVNGNPNTAKNPSATGTITTVSNIKTFPRRVLIEEFTTEYCGYCPDAATGLASFMATSPDLADRVAVVCHHAGYGTDWLTVNDSKYYTWFYNDGGGTYAPAFMYDRYAWNGTTPVVSRGNYKDYVEKRIAETSYANIVLKAYFNENMDAIHVTADCEKGWNFCDTPIRMTLFLTEDNIDAHSQAGAYGSFVHQHVLRSVNSTWGETLNWTGDNATYSYTFNLDAAWNTDNMKVVAMVSGYDSNNPTNCVVENVAVVVPEIGTGIDGRSADHAWKSERYSLDGRKVSAPQRGMSIIRMGNGSVKKVMKN